MKKIKQKSKRKRKEESSRDLKIFSPRGELIFVAKSGEKFCFDYQELIGKGKKRKSKYSHFRGVS